MRVSRCAVPDVLLLTPQHIPDERGYLAEVWNQRALADAGVDVVFVQENIAVSPSPFTVRGLHFQAPPHAQAKLMRVPRGRARYAVVDLRRERASYGASYVCDLGASDPAALFTPPGFAHGVVTLVPDTEIAYHVSAHHDHASERALKWDDVDLAIDWGVDASRVLISDKDRGGLAFRALASPFV